jgi:hypothetical protein
VSIIRPNAFFASRADMDFMDNSQPPCPLQYGQNGSACKAVEVEHGACGGVRSSATKAAATDCEIKAPTALGRMSLRARTFSAISARARAALFLQNPMRSMAKAPSAFAARLGQHVDGVPMPGGDFKARCGHDREEGR